MEGPKKVQRIKKTGTNMIVKVDSDIFNTFKGYRLINNDSQIEALEKAMTFYINHSEKAING